MLLRNFRNDLQSVNQPPELVVYSFVLWSVRSFVQSRAPLFLRSVVWSPVPVPVPSTGRLCQVRPLSLSTPQIPSLSVSLSLSLSVPCAYPSPVLFLSPVVLYLFFLVFLSLRFLVRVPVSFLTPAIVPVSRQVWLDGRQQREVGP